jgi:catechol 2,3-dioxygenase-like lactoylglutathione lyase family enzyme
MEVIALHHVNMTVPASVEEAAKHFYGSVMGLREVPKPAESKGRGGAWYQLGAVQLHLSREDAATENQRSKRHVCYVVLDLSQAEQRFRQAGVEIIPDDMPVAGWPRFYVSDPGGNRIEIAQDRTSSK